jgi:hypothetical protein
MNIGLAYWILMLIWAAFGVRPYFVNAPNNTNQSWIGDIFLFILLVLLGWHCFGAPLHG